MVRTYPSRHCQLQGLANLPLRKPVGLEIGGSHSLRGRRPRDMAAASEEAINLNMMRPLQPPPPKGAATAILRLVNDCASMTADVKVRYCLNFQSLIC